MLSNALALARFQWGQNHHFWSEAVVLAPPARTVIKTHVLIYGGDGPLMLKTNLSLGAIPAFVVELHLFYDRQTQDSLPQPLEYAVDSVKHISISSHFIRREASLSPP
jgi:hypothetical protein